MARRTRSRKTAKVHRKPKKTRSTKKKDEYIYENNVKCKEI